MNQISETSGGESWQDWVGRQETVSELLAAEKVAALAATLDVAMAPVPGDELPPGWHWLFFNPFVPRSGLGPDGHPKRGGFLPPVPLPRRMWAGGRVHYSRPLTIGKMAARTSTISKVETKSGRAGTLVFVTVVHRTVCDDVECIVEEQDIVYREAAAPGAPAPTLTPAPEGGQWRAVVTPDPVLLFRYSALTANGHRIHYDADYARAEENYPALVVHGPLTATLLQNFAAELRPDADLSRFEFRGVHPLFVSAPFVLEAKLSENPEDALEVWARGPQGELAMRATAHFTR
ncbi:acyl-CoA dehydrogenase [Azorhizobium oxalatiphilum]|uniref:Acyl-CoA dehydrogenase n=1 Tax=Azorhizobium oxalatiphilum TaxID=980631 RepID=A0A917BM98_9HYPH|nr:MaoC family dehydratase N-terminal domain-containing protein [Azorhizobium oxalatiphilum]GGF51358.1 acyl-CoA dehydrogenase [Azorhizobium oxalatiphilum]